ncbi:MAG: hypothetical protein R3F65_16870 [bacterium]
MPARLVAASLLLAALAVPAHARWTVIGGGELWPEDPVAGHGVAIVSWEGEAWLAGGRPWVEYNTDTLRVGIADLKLGERLLAGVTLTGEYAISGLLIDHFVEGENQRERGFYASHVEGEVWLKHLYPVGAWAEVSVTGRRWFFERSDETDRALVLPPETWVVQPRVRLGLWRLRSLDAHGGRRLFMRLDGWAAGVEGGAEVRGEARRWGAIGPAFVAPDDRNDPAAVIPQARQWALLGVPVGARARVEVEERAGIGFGEDDLSRVRFGGMSPYVVPIPGAPWAGWLSETFVSGRVAVPVDVGGGVELAPTVAAAWLLDPTRAGRDEMGTVWGAGATAQWWSGPWQVDVRGGVSPTLWAARDAVAWSAWISAGWSQP